ncbi:MAG: hypothetical protein AAF827_17560 [Cyanobacteria bacterium P01_D01_bin.6]
MPLLLTGTTNAYAVVTVLRALTTNTGKKRSNTLSVSLLQGASSIDLRDLRVCYRLVLETLWYQQYRARPENPAGAEIIPGQSAWL